MQSISAWGNYFVASGQPLERREFTIDCVADDETVIEVAGCGLCHTDLGFISGAVQTKHQLPLILGHEISGKVVAAGEQYAALIGKNVIVPAVLPCGECELCLAGRDNICQQQLMPGNDFHGGFASHIKVSAKFLCELPDDLGDFELAQLSVVADAITTPYQSLLRSRLKKGDLAIVIGTGGVGLYMVQHAKNAGATVIALELDQNKLDSACQQGADFGICTRDIDGRAIKKQIKQLVKEHNLPTSQWKVFENSGSAAGQEVAFSLLSFAGTVGIIGFTMDKVNVRLSNIMAFDADVFGNWGCRPAYYPPVVKDVLSKKINLLDNIELYPLSEMNAVLELAKAHKLTKRAILTPNL
jgi:6-hydroxycyclohex-1-ene-1-carbonyl-CoA dehydrogenase